MLSSPQELRSAMDREAGPQGSSPLEPGYVSAVALVMVGVIHVLWGLAFLLYNATSGSGALNGLAWMLMGAGLPFLLLAVLGRVRPQLALVLGFICFLGIHYTVAQSQGGLQSLLKGFIPRVLALIILFGGWLNCRAAGRGRG